MRPITLTLALALTLTLTLPRNQGKRELQMVKLYDDGESANLKQKEREKF